MLRGSVSPVAQRLSASSAETVTGGFLLAHSGTRGIPVCRTMLDNALPAEFSVLGKSVCAAQVPLTELVILSLDRT